MILGPGSPSRFLAMLDGRVVQLLYRKEVLSS